MTQRIALAFLFVFVMIAAGGCTTLNQPATQATITATDATVLPAGAQPALVWTIDGQRVAPRRVRHRLPPGKHTVSVLPMQQGPLNRTLGYGASAHSRGIDIAEIDVELDAGEEVFVAAVVRRHRIYATNDGVRDALGPWQTTVVPLIVTAD